MASIPPAILALLVNISGYQLFLNPVHFPISPLLSSIIFTFAAYFIILQFEIYPLKLRRIPTVFIRTYEFFVFTFFLEFGLCNVWFPLETFAFFALSSTGELLKEIASYCALTNFMVVGFILQHYVTGIVVSYMMSVAFLLFILHCTYLIDVTIISKSGILPFIKDALETLSIGIHLVLNNSSCRWHTVGMRQEMKRLKRYEKRYAS